MADDSPLIDIASSVAEGSAIDWDKAEQTFRDGSERAIVQELRVLSKMAEVVRAPHATPPVGTPGPAEQLRVGELVGSPSNLGNHWRRIIRQCLSGLGQAVGMRGRTQADQGVGCIACV